MKLKSCFLLFCILIAKSAFSQTDSLWTLEGIANVTVCLYQPPADNSTGFTGGTGVVINHSEKYFLITATHVSKTLQGDATIVFIETGGTPLQLHFLSVTKANKFHWVHHPNADLSMIELTAPNKPMAQWFSKWSFPSNLISQAKETVPLETPVTFLGYPLFDHIPSPFFSPYRGLNVGALTESRQVFLNSANLAPRVYISRLLKDEMLERKRYDANKRCLFFYFDSKSKRGSEGSGVFYSSKKTFGTNGKTQLIGIMHGTPTDKMLPQFATVTPSFYIWDLLNSYQ